MLRVSSTSMRESWLRTVQSVQSDLARTQMQVTTGQKFTRPSEDPVGATRALQLDGSLQQTQQYNRNIGLVQNRLAQEETALDGIDGVLQRLRELAVTANNDSQSVETRAAIAREARQHLDALVQLANTQDGGGEYLFAGFQSRTRPFAVSASGVVYSGDQGARELQISADRRMADSDNGYSLFMDVRNGNGTFTVTQGANTGTGVVGASNISDPSLLDGGTYTVTFSAPGAYDITDSNGDPVSSGTFAPGQSISVAGMSFTISGTPATGDLFVLAPSARQDLFTTVQNFIDSVESGASANPADIADMHTGIGRALQEFDLAIGKVLEVRTTVGARLNALDAQEQINADLELNLKSLLSELRDLDYADALTRLQQQLTTLQAAQASYARTQGMSLFDYL